MDLIPFLTLRMDAVDEQLGTDVTQLSNECPEQWEELTLYLRPWLENVEKEKQERMAQEAMHQVV